MEIIPTCFELHVSYDWRVMALKLLSEDGWTPWMVGPPLYKSGRLNPAPKL